MERLLIGFAGVLFAGSVHAQQLPPGFAIERLPALCGPTDQVVEIPANYKEEPVWGMQERGVGVVTVWVNPETKSFTVILTNGKKSCVLIAGEGGQPS